MPEIEITTTEPVYESPISHRDCPPCCPHAASAVRSQTPEVPEQHGRVVRSREKGVLVHELVVVDL